MLRCFGRNPSCNGVGILVTPKCNARLCPSLGEFRGDYNVPMRDDDRFPVLCTAKDVPEFGFPELHHIWQAARAWLAEFAPRRETESFDPVEEESFVPRLESDDRSLCVDNADFRTLTVDFLKKIQHDFLRRFPLWRVILTGDDHSCAIVIYPNGIRYGNFPADLEPEQALQQLVPHVLSIIEKRERPQREHVAWLQRHLPLAVRAIGDRPFHVVGVLDSYQGDRSRLAVDILVRGSDGDAIDLARPKRKSKDFWWASSAYGVSAKGEIVSYISVPEGTPFCVKPWLPPADYRGPITIVERESRKRHVYEICSENIMRVTD